MRRPLTSRLKSNHVTDILRQSLEIVSPNPPKKRRLRLYFHLVIVNSSKNQQLRPSSNIYRNSMLSTALITSSGAAA